MTFRQILVRMLILVLALVMVSLRGQGVGAEDATPSFGAKGSTIKYEVIWGQPNDERLTISRKFFGIFFTGVNVTRQNAAGLNICATADSNIGYAFFKDFVYRLDLKQNTITLVTPTDISTKLFYQERFEIGEVRDSSHEGKILYLKAPDIGSGPKNPCSLQ
jgi:hypothetical protein